MRPHLIAAILGIVAPCLMAQSSLVTRDITGGKSCLGPIEVRATLAETSHEVVVAVVAGTLSPSELTQLQTQVAALYQSASIRSTLKLAAISGASVEFAGPFKTRAQLLAGFQEIAHPAPDNPVAGDAIRFYSDLAAAFPEFGGEWRKLVIAGRFPALDGEIAPYASAWIAGQVRSARLQANYWTPDNPSDVLDAAFAATAGSHLSEGLTSVAASAPLWEGTWPDLVFSAGLRVCAVTLLDDDSQVVATVPAIARPAGRVAPSLEAYARLRAKIASLTALAKAPPSAAATGGDADADLHDALEISPGDGEVLRLGAEIYRRAKDESKLASMLTQLTHLAPTEAPLFVELGHAQFRLHDWDAADRALLRARELKAGDPAVFEELARIRLTRGDDRGFLAFVDERLALDPPSQELWLLRADAAKRLGDWQRNAESTERAIALGPVPLERRTALVKLYLEHQAPEKALTHVRAVAANLPPDAAVRSEYAGFLDALKQPDEALAAWKRALEADPKLELAHYRITRILMDAKAASQALEAAEAGIAAAPASARLYLAKAEILEGQDRFYQARQTLRDASAAATDRALIARLAEMEDAGGENAARYYRKLAEAGDKDALDRGLNAARRDGDWEDLAWFQGKLGIALGATESVRAGSITIPGGMAALAFVAHSRPSSEKFLVEFARTVVLNYGVIERKMSPAFVASIREHFRRIAELSALGKPAGGKIVVTIAANDKNGQKNAEKILDLLGWKMHASKQGVKLEPAEKGAKAAHQETATALAIDEIGMQQALEAGKPFVFEIPMDSANVVLGEEAWRTQFYQKDQLAGGLVEAMAGNFDLAQTYAALGQMDPGTASALVAGLGLKTIEEKYATLLYQYSSSMAVEHGRAGVPGGQPAEAIWAKLVGTSPAQPGPFFRALLAKDDGKLLAYYTALGELDIRHQRLFTRNAARTAKFYELYKESPEIRASSNKHLKSGSFVEFLSEVPLDDDGNVDFPGSPEVWMVAKGQSHSTEHTDKLLKRLKRVVAPDVEDEILLRLAKTRYQTSAESHTELDNFVAVVRIDQDRTDPLDEASALLLAQHFAEDGAAYPYFSVLTGLGQREFQQFFTLAGLLRQLPPLERAAQLSSVESLIEIVCLAQQAGTLDEKQAAQVFGKIVTRFQKVSAPSERAAASLDLVREILSLDKSRGADADAAIQNLVLGSDGPAGQSAEEAVSSKSRLGRYRQVLDLQKVPSLGVLLALSDAARNLANGKGAAAAQIQVLDSRVGALPVVEVPKDLGAKGKEKDLLEAFQPRRLQEIVKEFHEKTSKKNVKLQDLEKLSKEFLEAIDAPTRWALTGVVYAYFLRPDDLLVSEDAFLLRKHQFVLLEHSVGPQLAFEPSELVASSERAGSYFQGTFAAFGNSAGFAAAASAKLGGDNGQMAAGKQLSAIRSTNWYQIRDEDLHLFGLKVAVAKEWIVRAATQPDLADSLDEATFGLLSLTRRAELSSALADRNWRSVWNVVTLSDQYFLADRYLEHYPKDPWDSPATRALRKEMAHNDGSRLRELGTEFTSIFGYAHPDLRTAMPYEEYEKDTLPFKLAERSAEFKLYLARYADTTGVSASALEEMAEPAARAVLQHIQLSDGSDWRSVLEGYAGFDSKTWTEALKAQ